MATTAVRLDPDEENTLDELAKIHGGRSNALRLGLRLLSVETKRRSALADLLLDWDRDSGPVSEDGIAAFSSGRVPPTSSMRIMAIAVRLAEPILTSDIIDLEALAASLPDHRPRIFRWP